MKWLAIDPGSRWTALVVRDMTDDDPVDWIVLDRDDLGHKLVPATIQGWIRHVLRHARDLAELADRVTVENAATPNPHVGMTNPDAIIQTAYVVGAVLATWPSAIAVDPDGFGRPIDGYTGQAARRILLSTYPAALVGPRETTGRGKGPRQHARAAWDLAGAAHRHRRYTQGDHP